MRNKIFSPCGKAWLRRVGKLCDTRRQRSLSRTSQFKDANNSENKKEMLTCTKEARKQVQIEWDWLPSTKSTNFICYEGV